MGRAVWVFRLAPKFPAKAPTAGTETQRRGRLTADAGKEAGEGASSAAGTRAVGIEWAVALAGLAALIGAGLALKQYFRHRRSVDSRYKAIIDQANDGIVIVDAATHQIQYGNPAFLARIGYTSAEAEALTLSRYFCGWQCGARERAGAAEEREFADGAQLAAALQERGFHRHRSALQSRSTWTAATFSPTLRMTSRCAARQSSSSSTISSGSIGWRTTIS